MTNTLNGLSQYLTEWVKVREKENQAKSFEGWLGHDAGRDEAVYREAARAARSAHATGLPGYGTGGETLAAAGLLGDGYAAYLKDRNDADQTKRLAAAQSKRDATDAAQQKGYSEYLRAWSKGQDSLMRSTLNKMLSTGYTDYESAYRYAVTVGLSANRAKAIAEMSVAAGEGSKVSAENRIRLLNNVLLNGMDYTTAYLYARACGMSSDLASNVGELAERAMTRKGASSDPIASTLGGEGR